MLRFVVSRKCEIYCLLGERDISVFRQKYMGLLLFIYIFFQHLLSLNHRIERKNNFLHEQKCHVCQESQRQ
jgi:hypothetical protein